MDVALVIGFVFSLCVMRYDSNVITTSINNITTTPTPDALNSDLIRLFDQLANRFTTSTENLLKANGYSYESYRIKTEDGYYLRLHRIFLPTNETSDRAVVFLQHGLFSTSNQWVQTINESLGYLLADQGYDVWMGDTRGNLNSYEHEIYTHDDLEFWEWSFDELSKYDLKAFVDAIINRTRRSPIYYVGYSQGTMLGFAGLSEDQILAQKIRLHFALGPVAYFVHSSPFVYYGAENLATLDPTILQELLVLYVGNKLNSTSRRNIRHYLQAIQSGRIAKYDFGPENNTLIYNQVYPPSYDMGNYLVPTMFLSGGKDNLAHPCDVSKLIRQIPHAVAHITDPNGNHMSLIRGPNVKDKYFAKIIKAIKSMELALEPDQPTYNNSAILLPILSQL